MKFVYGVLVALSILIIPTFASAKDYPEVTVTDAVQYLKENGYPDLTTSNPYINFNPNSSTAEYFYISLDKEDYFYLNDLGSYVATNTSNRVVFLAYGTDGWQSHYTLSGRIDDLDSMKITDGTLTTRNGSVLKLNTPIYKDVNKSGFFFNVQSPYVIATVEEVPKTLLQNLMTLLPVGLVIFSVLLGAYLIRRVIYTML